MYIGIPRALFYHQYYIFWKTFFNSLGHKVVLSTPTNKEILKNGIELCVDDACLPIKIFHGHIVDLIGKADVIYVPRIISIEPKEYICPKFLGLPDMVRNSIPNLPDIIDLELNLYKGKIGVLKHILQLGKILNTSGFQLFAAFFKAIQSQKQFESQLINSSFLTQNANNNRFLKNQAKGRLKVLLLGHSYNIYDDFISMGLIRKLQKHNIDFITCEMVSRKNILKGAKKLPKNMFWTLGKRNIGTAGYFLEMEIVNGIIYVASFGCGPDSLVGELIEKKTKTDCNIPFLYINLDEHAGEAGFNTRLEAFLDVIERREYFEDNFPTYG